MVEIANSPEKKLTLEEIKKLYDMSKKVIDELNDMIILGSLKKEANFYMMTERGKMHARIFKAIRNYLKFTRN
jgi:predicted transcriptional regulator